MNTCVDYTCICVSDIPWPPASRADLVVGVDAWLTDATAAEAVLGHISTWDVSLVTDMHGLFCGATSGLCADSSENIVDCTSICRGTAAQSFNDDITGWDTSAVTSFMEMFYEASDFNQPLSWDVSAAGGTFPFYGECSIPMPARARHHAGACH